MDSSHPDWRVMVPHCGFDLHFSDNEWCWAWSFFEWAFSSTVFRQPCLILVKKKTSCMKMFLGNFTPYRKASACLSFLLWQLEIIIVKIQPSTDQKYFKKKIPGNFTVIQWLGLYASTPWVPSLVEELRSYKQCSAGKKKILKVPESKIWISLSGKLFIYIVFTFC